MILNRITIAKFLELGILRKCITGELKDITDLFFERTRAEMLYFGSSILPDKFYSSLEG